MTVYELKELLEKLPEDAEIILSPVSPAPHYVIHDRRPVESIEHDEDGTPIIYINVEF